MPKVMIREEDTTGSEAPEFNDYIVLIPGMTDKDLEAGYESDFNANSVPSFDTIIGLEVADGDNTANKIAKRLIDLGMTVHYVVVDDFAELDDYDNFWDKFTDKGLYNLRFLTTGNYRSVNAAQNVIKCAAERGDAIALIDIPNPEESGEVIDADYINSWINTLVVEDVKRDNGGFENPFKYAAAFARNVWFAGEENTKFPGSFAYLACFAKHTERFPDWFAMAGSIRGVLPYANVQTDGDFGDAEINKLQIRNILEEGSGSSSPVEGNTLNGEVEDNSLLVDSVENGSADVNGEPGTFKATNVIAKIRPYGNIVWGNRTLYPLGIANDSGEIQYGLTASSFLNIRNLCCDIKKVLYRAARRFTFEPNSDVLWFNFVNAIKPLLEEMRTGQGIKGYKIVKEATNKKAYLKARVRIIPIEAVEDFDLTVEMTDSIVVTE